MGCLKEKKGSVEAGQPLVPSGVEREEKGWDLGEVEYWKERDSQGGDHSLSGKWSMSLVASP